MAGEYKPYKDKSIFLDNVVLRRGLKIDTGAANGYLLVSDANGNATWQGAGSGIISWGDITGTLSDQSDLQAALNAKFDNPAGTTAQYIRGDGSLATFPDLTVYVPYTGATGNVNIGANTLITLAVKANSSAGGQLQSNSGADCFLFGAGGGANNTAFGGLKLDFATASTLPVIDASKNIVSSAGNGFVKVTSGIVSYDTNSYLTGLTIGTTALASGTVGRVLFEGTGNVLQENSNLNFDTTNGLIIGGSTARGTRLTVINSANIQATKVFVQRNAADSADYTTLRGDGSIDFNNLGSTANVLISAASAAVVQTYGSSGLRNTLFGLANAVSITGGTVAYNTVVGSECTLSSSAGGAYSTGVGFQINLTNSTNCTGVGTFTRFNGANRAIIIGGRSTAGPVRDITGSDVVIIGYATDANALNYTNSAVFYFNNQNASHWFHGGGNIGLFGKKYQILNDSTGSAANRLNTYMDINATNTITLHNGTAPSVQIADAVQVYGSDITAGNTALFVRTENNDIVKIYSIGGWGTPTGTLTRTAFDPSTVTLSELAERVAALLTDLKTGHQLLKA